ncbi:prolyl oligopeptidase family serine peptidase [Oleiagrimonas sp.]|jgi:prolyl oligopeptidase|uniref:prolyl oligopeptidase family serine peptidase n=1 Tax=Oleiagrimonas sp. TaxID=2010330 RepID=UPI0026095B13|nr:prolyl oligopeptidase family serine peptidase [Oleiagrimonas sp.]MDA3912964.1 prolyl oligopeptidase family serine peptidase [Oleiagrimonas sp.]
MNVSLRVLYGLAAMALTLPAWAAPPNALTYPPAHRHSTVDTYFGTKVPAPYQWMDDLSSKALHQWVAEENKLTDAYLAGIPVRGWIQQRLTKLWNYPKESTPDQLANGMLFFRRNSGLQNQSVVYVQDSPKAKATALLDPNSLSTDGSVALASIAPSPNGKYMAYGLSNGGSDWRTVHVLDVKGKHPLDDTVRWVKFSGLSWTHDSKGFFYSRYPEPPKGEKAISQAVVHQKLYYHTLGTPQSGDKLIFALPNSPHAFIGGSVSEDGRYLYVFVQKDSISNNALYYEDLGNPDQPNLDAKVKPLYPKGNAAYQPIGHVGNTLYLQTTLNAPRGKIVATHFNDPSPAHWRTVVPQAKGVLANAAMADGKILANYRVVAKSQVKVFSTQGKLLQTLKLPTIGSVGGLSARNDSPTVYYAFSSFLYPTTIYRYDVATGKTVVAFKPKVDFDPGKYQTRQVFYRSKDGTKVPMFIVARKGIKLDGRHPTVLYGYGGFDITITPSFNPMLPVWLELGGVYAVPNLRGGGVYGQAWHHAGMHGKKQNVFDDFAWAAKYLIHKGYTSSKRLAIQGYSNGGLLTGASLTERPKLFGAAYIGHGVLDMLHYQKFSGGAFWVPEYGSSSSRKAFQWLIKYSPLQNIHAGTCYPPTYITTSWDDDRVVPSHEFKFAAKIQRAQGCDNPILLHTTGGTSHTYMPTDKMIEQDADVWAFQAWNLGIKKAPRAR